ncbi:putative RNA-directed DNA polymerase from transposon BS [Diplonema papillatum]|nr:putative RNA-directed DNA polymerase from transposon BS [Diplonema papillatum]
MARLKGWQVLVVAVEELGSKRIARSSILVPNSSSTHILRTGSHRTCCYADLKIGERVLRIVSVYVVNNTLKAEAEALGSWIVNTMRRSPGEYVVTGDFNGNTTPAVEGFVRDKAGDELVRGRTTYQRSNASTSLDRVFVPRGTSCVFVSARFSGGSDHAAITVEYDHTIVRVIPPMRYPKNDRPVADDFDGLMATMTGPLVVRPPRYRTTKIARLQRALNTRLLNRRTATNEDEKKELNRQINDIRRRIAYATRGENSNHATQLRRPYEPPNIPNVAAVVAHFQLRYDAVTSRPTQPAEESEEENPKRRKAVTITPQDVALAIPLVKKKARTTDLSATFLSTLRPKEIATVADTFNEWLETGIPHEHALSWIFLLLKPGAKQKSPNAFRPIAIMPLMLKCLHVCLYLKIRDLCIERIRTSDFQYGCQHQHATLEILQRAQEWLDSDIEDPAVVIADIEAAYDTVPHDKLLEDIRNDFGDEWANSVKSILGSQWFTLTTNKGYTQPMAPRRGLLQGSPLSVILYLYYTADPPAIEQCKAYIDDLTSHATIDSVPAQIKTLNDWMARKGMKMARRKLVVVATRVCKLSVPGHGEVTTRLSSRLLGGCLHGDKDHATCTRNRAKMERFSRVCALVAQSYFCSTRGKCDRYRSHALPTLAVQAIAKCFDPSHPKLLAAYNKLIPKHRGSKGIANYPACTFGYGMTPVKDFAEQQRARAYMAAHPHATEGRIPATGFELGPPRRGRKPYIVTWTEKALRKAEAEGGEIKVATDGSYHEREGRGSVGVYVNGTAYGAKIQGRISSSTDAELCALMVLATALDAVQPQATVTLRSDSQSAIARTRNPRKGDPVAAVLRNIPVVQWARGHRDNADINAADEAATNAHQSIRSFDIEWCYSVAKVTRLCRRRRQQPDDNDEANDLVQLEESGRFLRRSRNCSRDMAVRDRLTNEVPPRCLSTQTLRALRKLHGATDLLQALVRRTIMPFRTSEACAVVGCVERGSAKHVLTANDELHVRSYGPEADLARIYGQCNVTYWQIMDDFAARNATVMKSVCERISYQEPSGKAAEWASWLKHELKSSPIQ